MLGVGRDLCGSSSPTLLPKQGHLQQAAEDLVQAGLEYLQRRRLHHLPGQPVPVLCHQEHIFLSDGERRRKGIRRSVSLPLRPIQDLKKSMEIFPLSSLCSASHPYRARFVVKAIPSSSFCCSICLLLLGSFSRILINLYNLWPLAEPFFYGMLLHCMRDCMVEGCSGNYS